MRSLEITSGALETTSQFGTWKQLIKNECGRVSRGYSNCWRLQWLLEATATVGSCGDRWKLRRVAGKAHNMTENALSVLIFIFSVQLQQTVTSDRKKAVYFPARTTVMSQWLWVVMLLLSHSECEIFEKLHYLSDSWMFTILPSPN